MSDKLFIISIVLLTSCNPNTISKNEHSYDMNKRGSIMSGYSTNDAVRDAERKFKNYLPKILQTHHAVLDTQESYTGDFTGDGVEDVAIYFSLSPKEGGNAMIGQGLSLYRNEGNSVKVIAGYEPDYLFSFKYINKGRVFVDKLEYAEGDGRCCPSIKTEHALTISGSSAY